MPWISSAIHGWTSGNVDSSFGSTEITSVWEQLRGQIFLGDGQFGVQMQRKLGNERDEAQIPNLCQCSDRATE
jgi:hypothetical protein